MSARREQSATPLALRERKGPVAKRWEGEGIVARKIRLPAPSPSHACGVCPSLSRKGRGENGAAGRNWSGRRDLHPCSRLGRPSCCSYTTPAAPTLRNDQRPLVLQTSVQTIYT